MQFVNINIRSRHGSVLDKLGHVNLIVSNRSIDVDIKQAC